MSHINTIGKLFLGTAFLLFMGIFTVSPAQIGDGRELFRPELLQPTDVHTVDLNNDGRQDVVTISTEDGRLVWYENRGGSFSGQKFISSTEPGAVSIEAADFDSDGDNDILVATFVDQTLTWYENDQQNFSNTHLIDSDFSSRFLYLIGRVVHTADVNVDGNPDVLFASSDTSLVWYRNTGSSFDAPVVIENGIPYYRNISDFTVGDLTKNNRPDIVYAVDNNIYMRENHGSGYRSDSVHITGSDCLGCDFRQIQLADMDRDGDLDLLTSNSRFDGGGEIRWHEYQNGSFADSTFIHEFNFQHRHLEPADIDFDGDPDIIIYDFRTGTQLEWMENLDPGFSDVKLFFPNERRFYTDITVADMDGDTDPDIVQANDYWNRVNWIENQDFGNFERRPVSRRPSFNGLSEVIADDFTGNDKPDLALLFHTTNQLAWMQHQENGFSLPKVVAGIDGRTIQTGDMDGNGDIDLLVSTTFDSLKIYLNSGTDLGQRFSTEIVVSDSAGRANVIHTEDVDNDGDLDIVTGEFIQSRIVWYENQTTGFSGPNTITEDAPRSQDIDTEDLDGDGDLDIIATLSNPGELVWFKNQNTSLGGRFGNKIVISDSLPGAREVEVADFDNDGDLDLATTSNGSAFKIAWFENLGDDFSNHKSLMDPSLLYGVYHLEAEDLNDDGYTDLVAEHDSSIVWFQNDQSGSFSEAIQIDDFYSRTRSIDLTDMNQDGSPDLLSTNWELDQVMWYENSFIFTSIADRGEESPKEFELSQNFPNPFNPTTRINFKLAESGNVRLSVFNILGQKVATILDKKLMAGSHTMTFDGQGLASGIYTYQLKAGDNVQTKKMMLIK